MAPRLTRPAAAAAAALLLAGGGSELARLHSLYTRQFSVCMRANGYLVE